MLSDTSPSVTFLIFSWSIPTKNLALPKSRDPGSEEGASLPYPGVALGPGQQKGHWPVEKKSHTLSSHEHPQRHTPVSLIFPQIREKHWVNPHEIVPPDDIMRYWLERNVPPGLYTLMALVFGAPALPPRLSETRFAPTDVRWGSETARFKSPVQCAGSAVVDNETIKQQP